MQRKPGQLIVTALQFQQILGQFDSFDSANATDPGLQIAALEIVTTEPGSALRERTPEFLEAGAGRRRRRVIGDG